MKRFNHGLIAAILLCILFWVLIGVLCCCAHAGEPEDWQFSLVKRSAYTLYILDTWTTFGLLQSELYVETNPLWAPVIHNEGLTMAIDFGVLAVSDYFFDRLYGWNKPVAYIVVGVVNIAYGYCVVNNWRLLK